MSRQIRIYSDNQLFSFIIAQGQEVSFDLLPTNKNSNQKPEHVARAEIENEDGTIIRVKYHRLGGLFGRKLVEKHVVILRRLKAKDKDIYQVPNWIGQLDLGVQVMGDTSF
ncbi:hypothetical protein [Bifidobacterium callitrichidarum]|uniref:Uncharacterized protein n=1 Tax=Bifidobacterium callitrichidarum TaxID=2052941 RepID=A0A2U2NC49_9BIFI|nr:hypothetical protein [Bifidobacterium callitrichidarum]PWG66660.1 hypothetical protein DF196_01795 [Bifidobacterium callitrichidarum]